MLNRVLAAFTLAALLASPVAAAVVQNIETDKAPGGAVGGDPYSPAFTAGGPSSSDLLEGMMPSATTDTGAEFTIEASTGLSALTDGTVDTFYGGGTSADDHTAYLVGSDGDSITYSLGAAYDLSEIVIFGGWPDGGRDQQHYDLLTSTDGVNFSTLSSIDINPGVQGADTTPVTSRVSYVDDAAAYLAMGVTHLQVNFLGVENGYTGYSEIDVFGDRSAVPEPMALALAVGTLGACLSRGRRRAS